MTHLNGDIITACADLVGRAGAREFEIGHIHDNVPVDEAGWYAHATYQGARIQTQDHRSPTAAALALAERLLANASCRCGRTVTLSDDQPDRCRWRLTGARWEPGCDAPPIRMDKAMRGDWDGMNRAMRRRANRNRRR